MFHLLFDPFVYCGFMRRAIVICCALSLSSSPLGVFLLLRRMSLIGDALSHSILPGVAIGYFLFGTSIVYMGIGGLISGLLVAILSGWLSSKIFLKEDAVFSGIYLIFLSFGIVLMSVRGSNIDVLGLLFGSIFSIDVCHIKFIGIISSFTFISLALFYRALVIESFDVGFVRGYSSKYSYLIQIFFFSLVVLNLVASLQVIGTLMSIGLMTLPSLSAYCWTANLFRMLFVSICVSLLSSWIGLLGSFYTSLPAGPIIILCNGVVLIFSMLFGKCRKISY